MKFFVWILIVTTCALSACKQHKGYIITGELVDANGLKVELYKITPDSIPFKADSCIIKKGKFKMKGTVEYPEYYAIYVGNNGPFLFFVENTEIKIKLNLKNFNDSKVIGSKETDLFVEFNNKMAEFLKSDSIQLQHEKIDSVRQLQIDYMKQFADENPNSLVTAFVVDRKLSYYLQPEELKLYINSFDDINSNSPWVQSIIKKHEDTKSTDIGQLFVDLKKLTTDGNEIAISDYVDNEKHILIYFWASWCGQCRKTNPELLKLYNKYKVKDLEIVGISLDKNKDDWTKAIETDELTWPQMSDLEYLQSEGARLYSAFSLPHTVLLDKDGIIINKGIKIDELEEFFVINKNSD